MFGGETCLIILMNVYTHPFKECEHINCFPTLRFFFTSHIITSRLVLQFKYINISTSYISKGLSFNTL